MYWDIFYIFLLVFIITVLLIIALVKKPSSAPNEVQENISVVVQKGIYAPAVVGDMFHCIFPGKMDGTQFVPGLPKLDITGCTPVTVPICTFPDQMMIQKSTKLCLPDNTDDCFKDVKPGDTLTILSDISTPCTNDSFGVLKIGGECLENVNGTITANACDLTKEGQLWVVSRKGINGVSDPNGLIGSIRDRQGSCLDVIQTKPGMTATGGPCPFVWAFNPQVNFPITQNNASSEGTVNPQLSFIPVNIQPGLQNIGGQDLVNFITTNGIQSFDDTGKLSPFFIPTFGTQTNLKKEARFLDYRLYNLSAK